MLGQTWVLKLPSDMQETSLGVEMSALDVFWHKTPSENSHLKSTGELY